MMKFTTYLFAAVCVLSPAAAKEKSVSLFNGKDLTGWQGVGYEVKDGAIICTPKGRNLMTKKVYTNYIFEFEFKLPPGGNNGIGIHYPGKGNPAFTGMEVQVLDNTAKKYSKLKDYQFHGGLYTLKAAKKGHLKPVGEWNKEKITVNGSKVTVELNGTVINEADLDVLAKKYPKHAGVKRRSGHITFCGHGDPVQFRGMKITELAENKNAAGALNTPPKGFTALFNGTDLKGWFGHGTKDPRTLWKMDEKQLEAHKEKTRKNINKHWSVKNGELINDGHGLYLTTNKTPVQSLYSPQG
ncbi:MAG: 3-keto-disaccharide hydrolase, partial [Akkermansiaceae bacterium]